MSQSDAFTETAVFSGPKAAPASLRMVRPGYRDREYFLRRALLASDMVALWLAMVAALALSSHRAAPVRDSLWLPLVMPLWAFLFRSYGLYGRPVRGFEPKHLDDAPSLFHALLVGVLGIWVFYELMPVRPLSPQRILIFGVFSLVFVALLRVGVRKLHLRIRGPERVFAVAPADDARILWRKLKNHPEYEMELVGALAGDGVEELGLELTADLAEVEALVGSRRVDRLLVQLDGARLPQERVTELMRSCFQQGVRFDIFPRVKTLLLPGVEVNHVEGMGILSYEPPVLSRSSRLLKRGMDLALSSCLLILSAPLLAIIAIAVKLDSKGPVLYWQTRVGKDEMRFRLVKFRTMVPGADAMTAELMAMSREPNWLALDDDPRRTRVGRLLRVTSLDELPQLWNVLKGEMSMVGPRPLPERDDHEVLGWQRHRLDLLPGLTGHWQVLGRTSIPFNEMVEIDYAYVASWSLWRDLKLLIRTIPVVLMRRGAK